MGSCVTMLAILSIFVTLSLSQPDLLLGHRQYSAATFSIRRDVDCGTDCRPPDNLRGNDISGFDLSCQATDYPCPMYTDGARNCTLRTVGEVQSFLGEVLDDYPKDAPSANGVQYADTQSGLIPDALYVKLLVGLCEHTVPLPYDN